jgi:ADP-ribose pyrophosphatase
MMVSSRATRTIVAVYRPVPLPDQRVLQSAGRTPPGGTRAGAFEMTEASEDRARHARTAWTPVSTRRVYENPWIKVREDIVALPDGRTTLYGVVECSECVGVLPFVDADHVLMVGQYRYVSADFSWEMPTGAMHAGESEEHAVQRELAEEAGVEATRLTKLCAFHTSKSVMRETAHLYLAEGLSPAPRASDDTEFIEIRTFAFDEVLRMVLASEIKDSMTVIAVLHAARRRGG